MLKGISKYARHAYKRWTLAAEDWIDVRDLLRALNISVIVLMLAASPFFHHARYADEWTLLLGLILALLTHVGLSKKGPSDPFVIILLYYVVTYYTFRIVTLAVFDTSDVFRRYPYSAEDTNYALTFVIACTACMLCGFRFSRGSVCPTSAEPSEPKPDIPGICRLLLAVLMLSIAASVLGLFDRLAEGSNFLRVAIFFVRPTALLTLVGAFFVIYYREISRQYLYAYGVLYLIYATYLTIGGTRGIFVYMIELLGLLLIANEKFSVNKRNLIRWLMLSPLLAILLILGYNFSTLQRSVPEGGRAQLEAVAGNLYAAIVNGDGVDDAKANLARILSRVGFLDFSSEIIAHKNQYKSIFNASYYTESFVDNLLTPGWDVYDTPKVSYALIFKYLNLNNGEPSKSFLAKNNIYHSDQLGIYGESYGLFGWCSLVILFVFCFSIKWIYYNIRVSRHRYRELLKKVVILIFFVQLVNSFGLDWSFVQMAPFVLTAFLIIFYIKISEKGGAP